MNTKRAATIGLIAISTVWMLKDPGFEPLTVMVGASIALMENKETQPVFKKLHLG